jgi:outer membrane protein assembly factor BamB
MTQIFPGRRFAVFAIPIALMLLLSSLLPMTSPGGSADSGTVSVAAWTCPASLPAGTTDQAALAAACVESANNRDFSLTVGTISRRRTTTGGQPVFWSAVSGSFSIRLETPTTATSLVFCSPDGKTWTSLTVTDNRVSTQLPASGSLTCQWYLRSTTTTPPTIAPTLTPMPTATTAPIATAPVAPTAPVVTLPTAPATAPVAASPIPGIVTSPNLVMFRGNPIHTGVEPGPGPTGQPQIVWKQAIGLHPFSSPAVVEGTVYVGGDDGLSAFDATTGTLRWHVDTPAPVISSPAVQNGIAYAGDESGIFLAVDTTTGQRLWQHQTGGKIRSSPAILNGVVYFTSYDGNAYALDATTGIERWSYQTDADVLFSSPVVVDGAVYFGGSNISGGEVYSLDAATGARRWSVDIAAPIVSSPTVANGVLYIGSYDGNLYGLDMTNGKRIWRFHTNAGIWSSPAFLGGALFFGSRDHNLYAVDAATGKERWHITTRDWVDGSPVIAGATLYVGSKDRSLYAVDITNGQLQWSMGIGGPAGAISSSPAVANGMIFVTSRDGFLYAINGG